MDKLRFPIVEYVHQQVGLIEERVRPAGILKDRPGDTFIAVCNRLASLEIYKTRMVPPRGHRGAWPPKCVVKEAEALKGIAAIIELWQEGKV
jgi:hypothetical protein